MRQPLISVITPSFNQAAFLPICLASVAGQDYPHLEHIVMDGGSDDDSPAILARHAGQLAHWESRPDGGQADAVNAGMRKATGDIVGWLNADDVYFPRTLSLVAEFFARNPDIDVVYGSAVLMDAKLNFLGPQLAVEPFDEFRLRNRNNFIPQPTVFMRRPLWEQIGGLDTSLHYGLDWDLWCRLAARGARFANLPHFLAVNRLHEKAKTSIGKKERLRELYTIWKRHGSGSPVFCRHMRWAEYAGGKRLRDIPQVYFWRMLSRRFWDFSLASPWTLGGFWQRGGNILAREAEINIPLFQPARSFRAMLALPASSGAPAQTVDVFCNGRYLQTRTIAGRNFAVLSFPILPEHAAEREIRLSLRFARTYGPNHWAALLTAAGCEP